MLPTTESQKILYLFLRIEKVDELFLRTKNVHQKKSLQSQYKFLNIELNSILYAN